MTQEFSELREAYFKIDRLTHEEYVLAQFMKNPSKWDIEDLINDLKLINRRRLQMGKSEVDLEYFKKWRFNIESK